MPANHLTRLIRVLEARSALLTRQSARLSWLRLGIFFAGFTLTVFAFALHPALALAALLISAAAFTTVVVLHRRAESALKRLLIYQNIKTAHQARAALDWAHIPPPQTDLPPPGHPFAHDLDLLGHYSLHHLLDTSVTIEGGDRLAAWLLDPRPTYAASHERQSLVRELIPQARFRDKLALYGRLAGQSTAPNARRWHTAPLYAWLMSDNSANAAHLPRQLSILSALAMIDAVLFLLHIANLTPALWVLPFIVYFSLFALWGRAHADLFERATAAQDALRRIQPVFAFLESGALRGERLRAVCAPFMGADRPSHSLRRLGWIVSASSLHLNPVVWFGLNAAMPFALFLAWQLHRLRRDLAATLPRWLDTWHDLEALSSLANFAALNPAYALPELIPDAEPAAWRAVALGHPLIDREKRVSSSFAFASPGDMALITGSNMSGKSTFLRTVGVNMVLAYAGTAVCAAGFDVSVFRLFTSMRIDDSLEQGVSYFYAEVRRLKTLLDALHDADSPPLFYLIDEIFRGTNNRERFLGSQAYILALVSDNGTPARGLGIVSTHDLELTKLAGERIHNYHFADQVVAGEIKFDYAIRPGASYTTNALRIMALEGLPVDNLPHTP